MTIFVLISTIKHFLFISIVVAADDAAVVVVVVVDNDDAVVVHQIFTISSILQAQAF